jgi:hypothetical protein
VSVEKPDGVVIVQKLCVEHEVTKERERERGDE